MRFLVLLAALFAGPTVAQPDDDPNFRYAITFQRGLTITRFAKPEYAEGLRTSRPEGVNISWTLEASDEEAGSASKEEIAAVNLAISEALKSHHDAVLVLSSIVLNRQGLWALYASDGARLAAALEASLDGKTRKPVRIRMGKDPNWKAFTSFLDRLREER